MSEPRLTPEQTDELDRGVRLWERPAIRQVARHGTLFYTGLQHCRILDLLDERDQLRRDRSVLAAEVMAWREHDEAGGPTVALGTPGSYEPIHVCARATDASGALTRATEPTP